MIRLGLLSLLKDTVSSSTNPIESAFSTVREATRNAKRWRNGNQVLRWSGAALLDSEQRFNRIKGYRDIPMLVMRIRQHLQAVNREAVSDESEPGGATQLGLLWSFQAMKPKSDLDRPFMGKHLEVSTPKGECKQCIKGLF